MICPPCRDAADGPDRAVGHVPEICRDSAIQPAGCACQHRPVHQPDDEPGDVR